MQTCHPRRLWRWRQAERTYGHDSPGRGRVRCSQRVECHLNALAEPVPRVPQTSRRIRFQFAAEQFFGVAVPCQIR
jgi:hypothetical protein